MSPEPRNTDARGEPLHAAKAAAPASGAGEAAAGDPHAEHLELQERLGSYYAGALTSNLVALGDKLGLYAGLKRHGPCTAGQLAAHLNLNERYCAEWLRQQAAAKLITTDQLAQRYWLTRAQQDCLVHEHGHDASPYYCAGGFMSVPALARLAEQELPTCFETGKGISYEEVDHAITCGTCRELGVWVRHSLVPSLRGVPGLEAKLEQGCQVADVGCGCGEALLTVAAAFPKSTFHGYDIAEEALSHARKEAASRGLSNVEFFNAGLKEEAMPEQPTYQLVMTHDAIHDMAHPRPVMAAVRKAVAPDGCWIVGDMSSLESHAANVHRHPLAAYLYGFSVHLCLPSGMSAPGGEALGTLGIPTECMVSLMKEAGFGSVEVLDFDHPLNRYYIARP